MLRLSSLADYQLQSTQHNFNTLFCQQAETCCKPLNLNLDAVSALHNALTTTSA